MKDFLEELAQLDVAEPPPDFNRELHARVNRTLVVQHVIDFILGAAAWGTVHFLRASLGAIIYTITGRYPERDKK